MTQLTEKYLLNLKEEEISDKYTDFLKKTLHKAKSYKKYKGWHTCICGAVSTSSDLYLHGYITNSLALHYMQYHRSEVPQSEITKLDNLI